MGLNTYLVTDDLTPLIMGGFSCVPENYEKMKDLLVKEMNEFAKNGRRRTCFFITK